VKADGSGWYVAAGLVAVCVTAILTSATWGALVLAALLFAAAAIRALAKGEWPTILHVRSRTIDVSVLAVLGLAVFVLSQTVPQA